jgi:amidase
MARTVRDAALFLAALRGEDDHDTITIGSLSKTRGDYSHYLDSNGLKGAKLGIIRDFMGFHTGVDKVMETSFEALRKLGAELIDVKCGQKRSAWNDAEGLVLQYELKADMKKYLMEHPGAPAKSLKDIIDFNEAHAKEEMSWFGQEFFLMAESKGGLEEKEYIDALALSKKLTREIINKTLQDNKLHAMITPTNAPAWTIDLVNGDHYVGGTSDLAAISGYPCITVPAGQVHGLPIGLSFIGNAWDESTLIKLAYSFEQGTMQRTKPLFEISVL